MYGFDERCERCREPTKRVTGCWDGVDPSNGKDIHGYCYDCKDISCPIRIKADADHIASVTRSREVRVQNLGNGVDVNPLERQRLGEKYVSIRTIAKSLAVSPATYCDWVHEREPMPPEKYHQALTLLNLSAALSRNTRR